MKPNLKCFYLLSAYNQTVLRAEDIVQQLYNELDLQQEQQMPT